MPGRRDGNVDLDSGSDPSYTTPTPNPSESNSIPVKEGMRPKFEFAKNPILDEGGAKRLHPDETRDPGNMRWVRDPTQRSR